MQAISLLGRIAAERYAQWSAHKVKPVRTPAPLGLHQDSVVEPPLVSLITIQGEGGLFPDLTDTSMRVTAVGKMSLFGATVYRSYLSDGRTFIQTVAASGGDIANVSECALYTLHTYRLPSTSDDIAFFIGRDAVTQTQEVPGTGFVAPTQRVVVVQEAVPAYIGWPSFQLDRTPGDSVLFDRTWSPGNMPSSPVLAQETVWDASGATFTATHRLMHYARALGDSGGKELMFADFVETDEAMELNCSVGFPLQPGSLKVYPSAM